MRKSLSIFLGAFAAFLFPALALAAPAEGGVGGGSISAGLAIGIAVLGGTLGQGRAASAALEGIARNPGAAGKIQTPMILALALMESLVILAWLLVILGKL